MDASPFHRGERVAQALAGVVNPGHAIRTAMPLQHQGFFPMLAYVFLGAVDASGWPLATVVTGPPGFVHAPDPVTLRIDALPDAGDPANAGLVAGRELGVLGIDLATRRRNRANGRIAQRDARGLTVAVRQNFGNCPQYIQRRGVHRLPDVAPGGFAPWAVPGGDAPPAGPGGVAPAVADSALRPQATAGQVPPAMPAGDAPPDAPIRDAPRASPVLVAPLVALDDAARRLIAAADTLFVASRSGPGSGEAGGADISHRGGRPGFVRLAGDTLTIPDFHGNGYFNTLGNLLGEPRAALLFIDFERGDLLQLQGTTEIDWNPSAAGQIEGAERSWRFQISRAWRRTGALPLRWSFIDYAPTTLRTGTWP
jgi:hypothetical protein